MPSQTFLAIGIQLVRQDGALTWADVHDGAGTGMGFEQVAVSISTNLAWKFIGRTALRFSTEDLPVNSIVISATLSLYGKSKANTLGGSPSVNIFSFTPAGAEIVIADYSNFGSVALSSPIAYDDFTVGEWMDFVLLPAAFDIIEEGAGQKTWFGFREATYDAPDVAPTWVQTKTLSFSAYEDTFVPKLVVEYGTTSSRAYFIG